MRAPPLNHRRLAALAILLVLPALPISGMISLLALYRSNLGEIAEREARIQRFEAVAGYAPELAVRRTGSPKEARAQWFLPGSDPAIAAAGLQAKLKELAETHGIDVTQARDMKPRLLNGIAYVGVGLEMSGAAEGIAAFLGAVDSNIPLLIVRGAEMRAELSGADPRYDPLVLYLGLEVWGALAQPPIPQQQADGGS